MFESVPSNIIILRGFVVFEIFDYVEDNSWLNFEERNRRDVEGIIKCIINEREVRGARKVSGVGENCNA